MKKSASHITILIFFMILFLLNLGLAQTRGAEPIGTPSNIQSIKSGMGKTWAVLVANSDYSNWPNLNGEPYRDVDSLKKVLEGYQFEKIIIEKDLTMKSCEPFFRDLYRKIVDEQVNSLLIYFAGHGYYDELLDKGFWVPVDAAKDNTIGYFGDETIRSFVELYNRQARHVLLIADCCFGGNILEFRSNNEITPSVADLHNVLIDISKTSAFGITSGRKEERVANRSLFSRALHDLLSRNQQGFLRSADVAFRISKSVREVLNNQQPQYGPVARTHEFGQFVFIRKPEFVENAVRDANENLDRNALHQKRNTFSATISQLLLGYSLRTRDLVTAYQHVTDFGVQNKGAIENLNSVVDAYNRYYEDLFTNNIRYTNELSELWQNPSLTDTLSEISDLIIEKVHKPNVYTLGKAISKAINQVNSNRSENSAEKRQLTRNINEMTAQFATELNQLLPVLDQKIATFLSNLKKDSDSPKQN